MSEKIEAQDFASGLISFFKTLAAVVTSVVVVIGAAWWAAEPRVRGYLDERDKEAEQRLFRIENSVDQIVRALNAEPRPFVEFDGVGLVALEGPFAPGSTVPIVYRLRRNQSCETRVQVRFVDARFRNVNSALTYEISATRAPVTGQFITFSIEMRLPENMPPGRYAYAPLLSPQSCDDARAVEPPLSEFFNVE